MNRSCVGLDHMSTARTRFALIAWVLLLAPSASGAASPHPVAIRLSYHEPADAALAESIGLTLAALDYQIAGTHRMAEPSRGEVRFFDERDRASAQYVKAVVETLLAAKGHGRELGLLGRKAGSPDGSRGVIEVRISSAREPPERGTVRRAGSEADSQTIPGQTRVLVEQSNGEMVDALVSPEERRGRARIPAR